MLSALLNPPQKTVQLTTFCRFTDLEWDQRAGEPVARLRLEDASACLPSVEADGDIAAIAGIGWPSLVQVELRRESGDDRFAVELLSMKPAELEQIPDGASLLTRGNCREELKPALDALVAFSASIANPLLKSFLNRVLLDPSLDLPLVAAFADPDGLQPYFGRRWVQDLVWLPMAGSCARATLPHSPDLDDQVVMTQLAWLFSNFDTILIRRYETLSDPEAREHQTLRMLGPHWLWLAKRDPEMANDLTSALRSPKETSTASLPRVDLRPALHECRVLQRNAASAPIRSPARSPVRCGYSGTDHQATRRSARLR